EHPSINVPLDETSVPRESSYAPVVEKVAPAVVKVETTTTIKPSPQGEMPGMNDPFWQQFFGRQFRGQPQQQGPLHEHGIGSGVIITKDGYIITNNHVVDGASEVKVTMTDGREFTAKVIGRDPKSDVAVVKINADNLPTVPLADSDKVEVGDVVLAVGNPFGVGQTVTKGIVSATERGGMGIEDYEDFIQTDAAINPGNSGGALVDINGRLIGINTAILSRSGGSQGVGFAIPSDIARNVMQSLVAYGHVTRGYLGVSIQSITPTLADEFKLKEVHGALVSDVMPDSPAAKAGIKNGDVVLDFNGKKVADSRHLQLEVADVKPDTTVPVEILRNGEKQTLQVTVKQLPGTDQLAENNSDSSADTGTLNGVGVGDLDQQARSQFKIPRDVHGAIITQVDPSSPSADAGLKPGFVIEEINHHAVKDANDAVSLTTGPTDKRTLLRVWANGGSHYIVVDESKEG
ncbi:MAG TPA: DegQ family serine endoprotease, partial [Verrucomicrobiae bacterium]|nr:DegQ family serine endoprotease [Verrucomicrobiae bacterium]